jgi:hypothetical protein
MIRQAISCDVCGTEKRQTNHWFVAFEQTGELRLGGWTSRNRARPNSKHLCGQTCVHKLVDEYMARIVASKPLRIVEDSMDDSIEFFADSAVESTRAVRKESAPSARSAQQSVACGRDEKLSERLIARAESLRSNPLSTDRSLTTDYDFDPEESSARLIPTPDPTPAVARLRPAEAPLPIQHTPQPRPSLVNSTKPVKEQAVIELPLVDEAPSFSSRKWRSEAWERERAREHRATNNTPTSIATRLRLN